MPKYSELKREFIKAACFLVEEGKEHEKWFSPITGKYFRMSRHNNQEVPSGTEAVLRKQAGVPKKR